MTTERVQGGQGQEAGNKSRVHGKRNKLRGDEGAWVGGSRGRYSGSCR